jgi:cleavage and polyadenylation specificity factor subunit 2
MELNGNRILLDCGLPPGLSWDVVAAKLGALKMEDDMGAGIDAVLLSHADMQHMGALPVLFQVLGPVPVVCTLPVLKMGQMVLYDYFLNVSMEGLKEGDGLLFNLDDVDGALENAVTVRYNQTIKLPSAAATAAVVNVGIDHTGTGVDTRTSVCAYPAGRTIGGSLWSLKYAAGDVLYAMDMSLGKTTVVNGLPLSQVPVSPSLLLMEGSHHPSAKKWPTPSFPVEMLLEEVMATVRNDGNVLIPCESTAKTLDLLKILGDHWDSSNLGLYNLVFLSHMSHNVVEFARSQLEWMSEELSLDFYKGKSNPFRLDQLKTATSIAEIDLMPGPKVVLATDSSLDAGLAKTLLLRWGGDPRSKVIFTDALKSPTSLAAEIRAQLATCRKPLIVTVHRPEKVRLKGTELEAFNLRQEELRRRVQEEAQIMRRETELAQLVAGHGGVQEKEQEQEQDQDQDQDQDQEQRQEPQEKRAGGGG